MQGRKFILLGDVDAGKTSLCNALYKNKKTAIKTQQIEYVGNNAIDLPGEYSVIPHMRMALLSALSDVNYILYVEPADGSGKKALPSDLLRSLQGKNLVGIISKIDKVGADKKSAYTELKRLGICETIFEVSIYKEVTIEKLRNWLIEKNLIDLDKGV